jgi:hypothetical protein
VCRKSKHGIWCLVMLYMSRVSKKCICKDLHLDCPGNC